MGMRGESGGMMKRIRLFRFFGIVERPGRPGNQGLFFYRVCGGVSQEAGGFGVEEEEHYHFLGRFGVGGWGE